MDILFAGSLASYGISLELRGTNVGKGKKNKKRKKRTPSKTSKPVPHHLRVAAESRTSMAATVAWTLSIMSTLAAEAIGTACRFYTRFVDVNELLTVLSSVMLFVSLIAGIVTLVLTPVVLRVAKRKPPTAIVQLALVAGALPIAVLVLQQLLQS